MKSLSDFKLEGRKVLMRCDFNVPLNTEGNILDDFRIEKTIPTIEYLLSKGVKLILMSHLDPGERLPKMDKIQERLMEYLDLSVTKAPDCVGKEVKEWVNHMELGEILLLENLRFHREEKENDREFAKNLAQLGEVYINDAFAVSHRAHASLVGVPQFLPAGAGFLLEKEIEMLVKVRENPDRPLVAIIGGTFKEENELHFLRKMAELADFLLLGGLMQKAVAEKKFSFANQQKIIIPVKGDEENPDLSPQTLKVFKEKISQAKTIFWTGPLGKVEEKEFQKGTKEIAEEIIKTKAFKVAGGGLTNFFLRNLNLASHFDHLSTGGGAMFAFLAGEKLPGIEALK